MENHRPDAPIRCSSLKTIPSAKAYRVTSTEDVVSTTDLLSYAVWSQAAKLYFSNSVSPLLYYC